MGDDACPIQVCRADTDLNMLSRLNLLKEVLLGFLDEGDGQFAVGKCGAEGCRGKAFFDAAGCYDVLRWIQTADGVLFHRVGRGQKSLRSPRWMLSAAEFVALSIMSAGVTRRC